MIQDGQVRRLEKLLSRGMSLGVAALKAGMNEKTARKYRRESQMPSEGTGKHWWRTRPDPSGEVWEAVGKHLKEHPGLQAKTLFERLQREYPRNSLDERHGPTSRMARSRAAIADPRVLMAHTTLPLAWAASHASAG